MDTMENISILTEMNLQCQVNIVVNITQSAIIKKMAACRSQKHFFSN